jgi:hypothetical protein
MFINRLIRLFAFLMFAGFFAIILWKVPRLDLAAVIGLGTLAVLYDLFETERRDRRAKRARSATS